MKRYLLDTNILMLYIRNDTRYVYIDSTYNPIFTASTSVISVVTKGELKALALKRQWVCGNIRRH